MPVLKFKDPVTGAVRLAGAITVGKTTTVDAVLLADGWVGDEVPCAYELQIKGVTDTSNQEIVPALSITEEQLAALQGANIQDGGQSSGTLIIKAYGEVPAMDIPIRINLRSDD